MTGLQVAGIPAINFDSDEGFGYGAIVGVYEYGDGGSDPYVWTFQPAVFLTTRGRRDVSLFFDSPRALPGGLRLDVYAARDKHIATPYYGMGNGSVFDRQLVTDENPYFYRFGRLRWQVAANVQRPLGNRSLRLLAGVGAARVTLESVPKGKGETLLARELSGAPDPQGWTNDARIGVIWDTRDRESGTRSGTFVEVLVQRADRWMGSDYSYTRTTLTDRRYYPLGSSVVLANRFLLQHVTRGAPLHDLHRIQTSARQQEGLGGAKSVRGLLKNRYVGRGLFLWNAEVRWRAADFSFLSRPFHVVLSVFADSGRVWSNGIRLNELASALHRGYGGGLRVGMGEDFVVAIDAGNSNEAGMAIYVGLGYLF
jgi:hypothetical protein